MSLIIVLTGGGSGGHLIPLLSVAKEIKKQREDAEFLFMGPGGEMEKEILGKSGIAHKKVMSGKLRRYFSLHYFVDIFKFPVGLLQSFWHLLFSMPDVVFSKGGYASVPVVLMARLFRIPVLVHESDAQPGIANQVAAAVSSRVAIAFERAKLSLPASKTVLTGIPVKESAIDGDVQKGREFLGMRKEGKPVVFFYGGSQGARAINELVLLSLDELTKRYQVIHQTGKEHFEGVKGDAQRRGYKIGSSDYYPLAFIGDELKDILTLADVVISRAGATSIAEIAANRKACILIPIEKSANNHQQLNAFEIAGVGGAIVMTEGNLTIHLLRHNIDKIMDSEELKQKMAENIFNFFPQNAGQKLAEEVLALVKK